MHNGQLAKQLFRSALTESVSCFAPSASFNEYAIDVAPKLWLLLYFTMMGNIVHEFKFKVHFVNSN